MNSFHKIAAVQVALDRSSTGPALRRVFAELGDPALPDLGDER